MQPDENGAPILLIDELDRTDEPFEAFLLEALSDFQVQSQNWEPSRHLNPQCHPDLKPHPRGA